MNRNREKESNQRAIENLINRFASVEAAQLDFDVAYERHIQSILCLRKFPMQASPPAFHSSNGTWGLRAPLSIRPDSFWWILRDNSESILLLHITHIHIPHIHKRFDLIDLTKKYQNYNQEI